jgi:secernin
MGSDMIVALKEASANGTPLFGLNHHAAAGLRHAVQMVPGQMHDPGYVIHASNLELPQARQTYTVLGIQPIGQWGFTHGVNEHRVALGVTQWQSRLQSGPATLGGPDLVRLALERSKCALSAVDVLTDLLERHGQDPTDGVNDNIFLIADSQEAFVLETAGRYWALQECGHTRVVTDAAMIRQDWRRLAPGLANFVIEQGWAHDDGSKIDFVRCLGEPAQQAINAHKRWGHASLALAQQQGAIDLHFLRRMLAEHYWENRDLFADSKATALASSFLVELHHAEEPMIAWVAFGPPKVALYFPLCLVGEFPSAFAEELPGSASIAQHTQDLLSRVKGKERVKMASTLERLQTKFDQDADEFLAKAHDYAQHGKPYLVRQIATEMMHNHVAQFEMEYRRLLGIEEPTPQHAPVVEEEMLYFA